MTTIDPAQLATIHGGMNTDGFRRSNNIEDRRPPEAVAEDTKWMSSLRDAQLGADWNKSLRDAQLATEWRQRFDVLRGTPAPAG